MAEEEQEEEYENKRIRPRERARGQKTSAQSKSMISRASLEYEASPLRDGTYFFNAK